MERHMPTTTKTPSDYLREPYSRILVPAEEGGFSAEVLEFPGCIAEGETAEETLQNLEAAARSWIEAAIEQGQEIPAPASNQGFSGKLALRLPRGLHKQAVRMAARDGVSLNQFLLSAIAARVGAEDLYERLARRLTTRATFIVAVNAPDTHVLQALRKGSTRGTLKIGESSATLGTRPELMFAKALAGSGTR
jgi:predicted RNase H-like HicB family nuclease